MSKIYSAEDEKAHKVMTSMFIFLVVVLFVSISARYFYNVGYGKGLEKSTRVTHGNVCLAPEVSLLKEKADCDTQGGEFGIMYQGEAEQIKTGFYYLNLSDDNLNTLTCTSPAKELFNIKVQ